MAAFAPIPSASVSTASAVNAGARRNCRSAKRTSCHQAFADARSPARRAFFVARRSRVVAILFAVAEAAQRLGVGVVFAQAERPQLVDAHREVEANSHRRRRA